MTTSRTSWIVWLTLICLTVIIGIGIATRAATEQIIVRLNAESEEAVALHVGTLERMLITLNQDLAYLARGRALSDSLEGADTASLGDTLRDWSAFLAAHPQYDQIRWLDETGMERIRVNQSPDGPVVVPESQLQNKANRYYFTEAMALPPGAVFVSPLDLNIEHDAIELPHKPMLRLAQRVFDRAGAARGIVIVNYLALDLLKTLSDRDAFDTWLLNQDGYWLRGSSAEDEWGFMLDRPERTLAWRYPAAWARLRAQMRGSFETAEGLWHFDTLVPAQVMTRGQATGLAQAPAPAASPAADLAASGESWKVVALVPRSVYRGETWAIRLRYGVILGILLVIILGSAWALARSQRREIAARAAADKRASEQRLGALIEQGLSGVAEADLDYRLQRVNDRACEILGWPRETLIGRRIAEFSEDEAWLNVKPRLENLLAGGPAVVVEMTYRQSDGTLCSASHAVSLLRDAAGAPAGFLTLLTDITARKEAEERLLISREHLRMATEGAELGVWYWDLVAQKMNWSALCQEHLALPLGTEPSLDHFYDAMHPDDRARVEGLVQAAIDAVGEYHAEYRILHPDGRLRWISAAGRVYLDAEGHPMGMGGITQDITGRKEDELVLNDQRERLQSAIAGLEAEIVERRKVEAELMRSEERTRRQWSELEAIYTTAPVGLFVLDREMRFQRLNERLAEMNGLPVANHLGRRAGDILPALADTIEPPFQQVLTSGEPLVGLEVDGHTPAAPGSRRFWRVNYYPLKEADGQIVGINGVVEEITKLKRIEDELRALNTELEAKVEARTAEARAASAAKSEFLAHMSHEIRTPLNAVLGLVQVMELSPLNPEQRDLIAHIRAAGRSLLLLLNDILDFSKIEAGQLQLEERPFVPAPLLEQLDSLLGLTARTKGLSFAIDAAPLPDGALVGDPLRLEQILTNLIGNAVKFTDRGEVRLHIRTLESDDDRARLRFEITDTGIGIAPEVLPQLFAAFNQGDSGISRRFGGTGLGLAISKRLVELMGGTIGVESRAGVGSTFWFELPFARTDAPAVSVTSDPAALAAAGPRLRGGHYLIVDDNALNLDVLERMLALHGARATRAGDGRAALDRLRTGSEDFDAVLMDVQMPVLDGLSATRAIRGELGLTELPVIAVTAGVLKDEQQRAHEAGVDAVLAKPVELDQLVALLSRWAPRAAVEPEADAVPTSASGDPGDGIPAAALPVIVGLDPAHVARLTHGDIAFYRRLLSGLVAEARGVPEELRAALASGAATEAAARLHRLRGVAANVGAVELAATLLELETALHEARPVRPADLETFETQVATLLASADPWLAQTEPATPDEPPVSDDAEPDLSRLAALREALAANRPRPARQLFAELQPGLSRHYGPAVVQAIAASLAALDFPAALRTLDAALSDTAAAPDFGSGAIQKTEFKVR